MKTWLSASIFAVISSSSSLPFEVADLTGSMTWRELRKVVRLASAKRTSPSERRTSSSAVFIMSNLTLSDRSLTSFSLALRIAPASCSASSRRNAETPSVTIPELASMCTCTIRFQYFDSFSAEASFGNRAQKSASGR